MKRSLLLSLCLLGIALACGPRGGVSGDPGSSRPGSSTRPGTPATEAPEPAASHSFPTVSIPSVYADDSDSRTDYVLEHYWDAFLAGKGATTPVSILGVFDEDVEQALANYIQVLSNVKAAATPDDKAPLIRARKSVSRFFDKLEAVQKKDTSANTYLRLTEMVSRYLYDPNSPLRDEDLYLPFVEAMESSACTRSDMRNAYRHEIQMCRTNPFGSKVPDIRFKDVQGHKGSLYAINADYTMLFFSNPGCESCKGIIQAVMSRGYIESKISAGKLAIVNVYIDEEVDKWRDYSINYPSCWVNGYDYTFSLRDSGQYDIRAIPSLYLLDGQKRVIMKDAPTERVLAFFDKI